LHRIYVLVCSKVSLWKTYEKRGLTCSVNVFWKTYRQ
jgi:hypothetical protein